jgi:hypothetical protein
MGVIFETYFIGCFLLAGTDLDMTELITMYSRLSLTQIYLGDQTLRCPVFVCLALHEQINISRQKKTTNEISFKYNPHNYLHEH